jgi:threonine dehydratase
LTNNDAELNISFKWENKQVTNSFKCRGAFNKILSQQPWELAGGIVTASAGNHGQGVALACNLTHTKATVFVSDHAVPAKVEGMRSMGIEIRQVIGGYALAEEAAIRYAEEHKITWISPYNDGQVIAGQGTIGLELCDQLTLDRDTSILVPLGGGGLLAGIGAAMEKRTCQARLVGVCAAASAFMHSLYHHGHQNGVADLPTLADGLSGAVEKDAITIPMVRKYADDVIMVNEEEIGQAIAFAWYRYQQIVEAQARLVWPRS